MFCYQCFQLFPLRRKVAGLDLDEEFTADYVDVETVHLGLQAVARLSIPVLKCGVKALFAQCTKRGQVYA